MWEVRLQCEWFRCVRALIFPRPNTELSHFNWNFFIRLQGSVGPLSLPVVKNPPFHSVHQATGCTNKCICLPALFSRADHGLFPGLTCTSSWAVVHPHPRLMHTWSFSGANCVYQVVLRTFLAFPSTSHFENLVFCVRCDFESLSSGSNMFFRNKYQFCSTWQAIVPKRITCACALDGHNQCILFFISAHSNSGEMNKSSWNDTQDDVVMLWGTGTTFGFFVRTGKSEIRLQRQREHWVSPVSGISSVQFLCYVERCCVCRLQVKASTRAAFGVAWKFLPLSRPRMLECRNSVDKTWAFWRHHSSTKHIVQATSVPLSFMHQSPRMRCSDTCILSTNGYCLWTPQCKEISSGFYEIWNQALSAAARKWIERGREARVEWQL